MHHPYTGLTGKPRCILIARTFDRFQDCPPSRVGHPLSERHVHKGTNKSVARHSAGCACLLDPVYTGISSSFACQTNFPAPLPALVQKNPPSPREAQLCKFGCSYLLAVSRPHALSLQPSVPFKLWIIQPGKSLYQTSDRRFPSFETLYSPMLNTTLTHVCYLDNQFQETDHDLDQRSPCITSSSSDLAVPHKLEN